MSFIAKGRRKFWFGTLGRMSWYPTPNRGADVSSYGWEAGGNLLNGGGYQLNSYGSHGNYIFEWPSSSSQEVAQKMKSYADGSYGRGLIYFLDPLIYKTNILPAVWAAPSMVNGYEGTSLVYGVDPLEVPTPSWQSLDLPSFSSSYDLFGITPGFRGNREAVFIPIPEGFTLALGALYSTTGAGGAGVYYVEAFDNGSTGAPTLLPTISAGGGVLTNTTIPHTLGLAGIYLYIGKSTSSAASITVSAMTGRLFDPATETMADVSAGPWIGGQGHSGCRFIGKPTKINYSGVNGGQVGFAASFREVGSWVFG